MRKVILQLVKAAFPVIAGIMIVPQSISGQQWVVANKDNTHPEQTSLKMQPASFASFNAGRFEGYNEITWTTSRQEDARKFVIEYSFDDVNYQTAGEVVVSNTPYLLKHYLFDKRPVLYRIRTETLDGKYFYSKKIALDGIDISPVQVYPTVVTSNMLNANASWPVQRVTIVSPNGTQLFAKEINGQSDYLRMNIPTLGKGMYWVTFFGDDWKSTSKILIP